MSESIDIGELVNASNIPEVRTKLARLFVYTCFNEPHRSILISKVSYDEGFRDVLAMSLQWGYQKGEATIRKDAAFKEPTLPFDPPLASRFDGLDFTDRSM